MIGKPLKVVIVGAGTGGLCLAQGLKLDNISVAVFERDYSPTDRLQGYRLSINTADLDRSFADAREGKFEVCRCSGGSQNQGN
jgi:2-polyprenyl-6-methoxyphenol hydroxylase-like FAD-dependent oxidoreductase